MADTFISAQEAARRTGLSTGALAKRRCLKKARHGWIYISSNAVVYAEGEVERFVSECRTAHTRSGARPCSAGHAAERIPDEWPYPDSSTKPEDPHRTLLALRPSTGPKLRRATTVTALHATRR